MSTVERVDREITKAVFEALSTAGISHRTAAERTGIPLSTLRRRLRGESSFYLYELFSLAHVLDVKLSSLIRDAEAMA